MSLCELPQLLHCLWMIRELLAAKTLLKRVSCPASPEYQTAEWRTVVSTGDSGGGNGGGGEGGGGGDGGAGGMGNGGGKGG